MNNTRNERFSANSIARRLAALVAGFAVLVGVLVAATPAQAEGNLAIDVSTSDLVVTFTVTGCRADSPGALYVVAPIDVIDSIGDSRPVPGWTAGDTEFTFSWTAPEPGTYFVWVSCLGYTSEGDMDEQRFTVTDSTKPNKATLSINPTTWRAGDQVTLTSKGLKAGEDVVFYLAFPQALDAHSVWPTKADANGVATVTVTWPTKSEYPGQGTLARGNYVAGARADSLGDNNVVVAIHLNADGVWGLGALASNGGKLPNTGD